MLDSVFALCSGAAVASAPAADLGFAAAAWALGAAVAFGAAVFFGAANLGALAFALGAASAAAGFDRAVLAPETDGRCALSDAVGTSAKVRITSRLNCTANNQPLR